MRRLLVVALVALTGWTGQALAGPAAHAADTNNSAPQTGRIVSDEPASNTPDILDGTVYSIAQVGSQIIVGGSFTQVQDANSSTTLTRRGVIAFDATTGKLNNSFTPVPSGTVYKVLPAADGTSVYVAGRFSATAGGKTFKNLMKVTVSSGVIDSTTFIPSTLDGDVRDLEVVGSRLWVAGKFTHVGGTAQKALATVSASTGKYDSYMQAKLSGLHNPTLSGSVTDVLQISTNPSDTTLMAVGNFTQVTDPAGTPQDRSQIVQLDISSSASHPNATLTSWYTNLYTQACSSKFDTVMTDVEYSPDGSYFVVSTTGAYGGSASNTGGSGCDVVARFEGNVVDHQIPTWTAYTGGDTTWTVEVTDNVIYTGGHMRWQNNPGAGDAAGEGAVARTGIAALNPVNGMAYSWNPTRERGVGIQDMMATDQGLYVGSDTDLFGHTTGNTYHPGIVFVPLSGGATLPKISPNSLPNDVYGVSSTGSTLVDRQFTGTSVTSTTNGPGGANAPDWGTVKGAFMVNGVLYTARSDGSFYAQTFDGSSYGPPTIVAAADALVYQTTWHTDVKTLTSLFYSHGRIYYTKSGSNALYYRGFETEDGVVGQQRFSTAAVSGVTYYSSTSGSFAGAFVADGYLYFAKSASTNNGRLYRAVWDQSANAPVSGSAVQVSGTGIDSQNWASRALFPFHGTQSGTVDQQPTAVITSATCAQLTCTFDGSHSSDPDAGDTLTYDWDFGDPADSTHGTGATPSHTYSSAGHYTVTLTVTDGHGGSSTTTTTVDPTAPTATDQAPTATAGTPSCTYRTCTFHGTGSDPDAADTLTYSWSFGDGTAAVSGADQTHTYPAADTYTATLTVSDGKGGMDTDTTTVTTTDPPAGQSNISFIGANGSAGSHATHSVTMPSGVNAGDTLLLFFSANSTGAKYSAPAGWTAVEAPTSTSLYSRAYTKTATASDAAAGAKVSILSTDSTGAASYVKDDITVAAYRSTDPTTPIAAHAAKVEGSTAAHVTPSVTATSTTSWLVSYWSDKATATTAWTPPAGVTPRTSHYGTSTSHVDGLLADSGGPVGSGAQGGLTATADASGPGVSYSVLLETS